MTVVRSAMHTRTSCAALLAVAVTMLASCGDATVEQRARRIENGLLREYGDPPWSKLTLAERMADHGVPGVSIAVINDFEIEWARGYGTLELGGDREVTADTLFQGASIGKLIVAVTALSCIEDGLIGLDDDVNASLVSWKIPESPHTAQEKVTLRRLLSHSAGVTVSWFPGYARGQPLPSLRQVLEGEPPANSPPIRVDRVPGATHRYSGGGYMIVQQLLVDLVGKPLPEIIRDRVMGPAGMSASTVISVIPPALESTAASGHRAGGEPVPGRWHVYPEVGAGASLWTTPSDLARFAIQIMSSTTGRSASLLSEAMATEMLTAQVGDRGLGPVLGNDGGDRVYFLHPGGNEGFRCVLVAYPQRGQGVVIMTNGDGGEQLRSEILRSVSVEYGWIDDRTGLYVICGLAVVALASVVVWRRFRRRRVAES